MSEQALGAPRLPGRAWWSVVLALDVLLVLVLPWALTALLVVLALTGFAWVTWRPHRALAVIALAQPMIGWAGYLAGLDPNSFFVDQLLLVVPIALGLAAAVLDWPHTSHRVWPETGPWYRSVLFWAAALALVLFVGTHRTPTPNYGQDKAILYTIRSLLFLFAIGFFLQPREGGVTHYERGVQFLRSLLFLSTALGLLGYWNLHSQYWPYATRLAVLDLNPIWYARFLGVGLLSLWSLLALKRIQPFTAALAVLALVPPFVLAGSRGPALALLVALTFFLVTGQRWNTPLRRGVLFAVPVVGLGVIAWSIWVGLPGGASVFSHGASNVARAMMIQFALDAITQPGWLGLGTGAFADLVGVGDVRFYPHNILLEIWLENGALGMAVLVGFFAASAAAWKRSRRLLPQGDPTTELVRFAATWWVFSLVNAQLSGDVSGNEHLFLAAGALVAWTPPEPA